MYIPKKYNEDSWEAKKLLIQKYPLATVVTVDGEGEIIANHFPFFLVEDPVSGKKYLHAHVAKANHQVPSLRDNKKVLVIFQSPNSYISPSYYPEKHVTHKFVPTWDFAALHLKGSLKIIDDYDFVREQLNNLTDQQEAPRLCPWKVSDAPERYTNLLQKAITGLQIEIDESLCKFKFEQGMSAENVEGTIDGLAQDGVHAVSQLVAACNGR